MSFSQTAAFITRSGTRFQYDGRPFYFLGANAYYLMEEAAGGDTSMAKELFATANELGMTVVRTWGFFDSPDSLNPAVIQWRPGSFSEQALRALDFVLFQAERHGIHLILPLVNNWDDYGGMNQYVRWRTEQTDDRQLHGGPRYTSEDRERMVMGAKGQRYRVAMSESFGHDDFYTDSIIRGWYRSYVRHLVDRVNTFSGRVYKDDPTILAWELANEPRSSDPSGFVLAGWVDEMSTFLKQVDGNHLVGTGEEGFDISPAGYSIGAYNNQAWLFNGTAGTAFSINSTQQCIDFSSIHLYPESWGLYNSAGNSWIRDHIRLASRASKPLVVGEFGVLTGQSATYDSWLTTALLDGGGGAMVWQLLGGARRNSDGYGIRCSESSSVCVVLQNEGALYNAKSLQGVLIPPQTFTLFQNYPNPFNGQTTIAYDLPMSSDVQITLFNSLGERFLSWSYGVQLAGQRKELLDATTLSSGAYFYRVSLFPLIGAPVSETKKLMLIK